MGFNHEKLDVYQTAIFDVCLKLRLVEETHFNQCRDLLIRIVSMLTQMARRYGDTKDQKKMILR